MSYTPNGMYQPYPSPYQQAFPDQLSQLRMQQLQMPSMQMTPQATNASGSPILWVQGEAAAKAYLVAPSSTVMLMDSETPRFYIKSTDGAGMPNMRIFEYKEVLAEAAKMPASAPVGNFVTREEFEEFKNKLDSLMIPAGEASSRTRRNARTEGGTQDESSV